MEGCHFNLTQLVNFYRLRFTVIGVTSYGAAPPSRIGDIPRVHTKITLEIKNWIKNIAKNAQESNCPTSKS